MSYRIAHRELQLTCHCKQQKPEEWNDKFKALKETKKSRLLQLVALSFNNEGEIKTFLNISNEKMFYRRPTL